MMEDQPPLTSPDGSRKRNPPQRRCLPLDPPHRLPLDSTQEGHTTSHHVQSEEPKNMKPKVKVEEDDTLTSADQQSVEAKPKDIKAEVKEEEEEETLVSGVQRSVKEQSLTVPRHNQSEEPEDVKPEVKEEADGQLGNGAVQSIEDGQMTPTWSLHIDTDGDFEWNRYYTCSECGKSFIDKGEHDRHQRLHGKDFVPKGNNQKIPTNQQRFSCSKCGKWFHEKEKFLTHQRSHTGERPLCSECGMYFASQSKLVLHQKRHQK